MEGVCEGGDNEYVFYQGGEEQTDRQTGRTTERERDAKLSKQVTSRRQITQAKPEYDNYRSDSQSSSTSSPVTDSCVGVLEVSSAMETFDFHSQHQAVGGEQACCCIPSVIVCSVQWLCRSQCDSSPPLPVTFIEAQYCSRI